MTDLSQRQHQQPRRSFLLAEQAAGLEPLLEAIARRNLGAFKAFYERIAPKLFGLIVQITGSRPLAEEVLQDVFLRIWQNAASFSPAIGSAEAWCSAIARNRAIDVVRQVGPSRRFECPVELDWFDRIPEPRDREQDALDMSNLRRCLSQLDEDARNCVLLAYYEGRSREELAQRFDRPVNTIKTWLHRSLASLRSCLEAPGP